MEVWLSSKTLKVTPTNIQLSFSKLDISCQNLKKVMPPTNEPPRDQQNAHMGCFRSQSICKEVCEKTYIFHIFS